MNTNKRIALILAGGKGRRLWPLSRENYPKQFIEFKDGLSLFQLTLKRILSFFKPSCIYIISSENYKFTAFNQIEGLSKLSKVYKDTLRSNLIFEPDSKNTAVGTMLALKYLESKNLINKDDILYVFPSDHIIQPLLKFKKSLTEASRLANLGLIAVFGIPPKYPQEGYGYILPKNTNLVKKFVEKPSFGEAKELIKKGAFWNSGIFCFKKDIFLEELSKFRPKIYKYYKFSFKELVRNFSKIPSDSIDYAIMQKTKKAGFIKCDLKWSDLGSWDSLSDFYGERRRNFNIGKVEFLDCQNCFVYSKERLVSLIGLKDLIVIDSCDSLLIVKKGLSDKVKRLVEILNRRKDSVVKDSLTIYRPWGYYTILKEKENYKVKEIGVYPKKYISLQKHKYRSEHWNIVEGKAEVILKDKKFIVKRNESIFVPKGEKHRVYNPGSKILKIIEVQIGSYLGEDDIKRFDRY